MLSQQAFHSTAKRRQRPPSGLWKDPQANELDYQNSLSGGTFFFRLSTCPVWRHCTVLSTSGLRIPSFGPQVHDYWATRMPTSQSSSGATKSAPRRCDRAGFETTVQRGISTEYSYRHCLIHPQTRGGGSEAKVVGARLCTNAERNV